MHDVVRLVVAGLDTHTGFLSEGMLELLSNPILLLTNMISTFVL